MLNDTVSLDIRLRNLCLNNTVIETRMSQKARDRYSQALWYVWGREDAGDSRLRDSKRKSHYLGNDFGFAEFAALEAEAFERQYRCSLSNIGDQYNRFVACLDDVSCVS